MMNTEQTEKATAAGNPPRVTERERFFLLTPTPTEDPKRYLDADENEMQWSGTFPPPAIGAPVIVSMNGIGQGTVKGYFDARGDGNKRWLGLIVQPANPPAWLTANLKNARLSWQREGACCVFGAEIREAK